MLFSIRKKWRIQVFSLNFRNPSSENITNSINRGSWSDITDYLRRFTVDRVAIVLGEQQSSLLSELDTFRIGELKAFFLENPSAWSDLKRKIHKYRSSEGDVFSIKKENEEYIFPIFLRLKNTQGTDAFESIIRREIFQNTALIKQISWEPSIIDSSHGNLSFLTVQTKKWQIGYIRRMIEFWMGANNDVSSSEETSEATMRRVTPEILKYLLSIFSISFDHLPRRISIWTLSSYLRDQIWVDWDKTGIKAKKAWTLVKAFSAWGSYEEINSIREKWVSQISQMQDKLIQSWIHVDMGTIKHETNGWNENVTIYPGRVSLILDSGDTFTCDIEYRLKSMRSILLKLWENEEYTNIDAMRDIIGMAIIWPDDTPQDTKIEIIWQFSQIMSNKSYVIKNKWLLNKRGASDPWIKDWVWKTDIEKLHARIKDGLKKPLGGVVSNKKEKTDEKFINASISGFTQVGDNDVWLEIQFFDQSKYDFWKTNHYEFDPLKVISAWSRGSWFLTPHQVIHCIQKEIPSNIRDNYKLWRPQDIFYNYLKSGKLIAYTWNDGAIYITPKSHEVRFIEKFNQKWLRRIHVLRKPSSSFKLRKEDWFREFISNLQTSSVPSTHRTS